MVPSPRLDSTDERLNVGHENAIQQLHIQIRWVKWENISSPSTSQRLSHVSTTTMGEICNVALSSTSWLSQSRYILQEDGNLQSREVYRTDFPVWHLCITGRTLEPSNTHFTIAGPANAPVRLLAIPGAYLYNTYAKASSY